MGVFTLTFFAIGTFIAGLYSAVGQAGFGLGALPIVFFGNPLSAPAYPHQFLPGAWGTIGQLLPNGAAATMMRSVIYFPEASITSQVWTLVGQMALGVTLLDVGIARQSKKAASIESPLK